MSLQKESNPKTYLSLSKLFFMAFNLYKVHCLPFVAIGIVFGLANVLSLSLMQIFKLDSRPAFVITNLLISSIATIAAIDAASKAIRRQVLDVGSIFAGVPKKYFNYLAVASGIIVVSSVGAMFFILPGILALTFFIFADILVVLEGTSFYNAFRLSYEIVKQHFWQVLLFNLLTNSIILILVFAKPMIFVNEQALLSRVVDVIIMVIIPPFYNLLKVVYYLAIRPEKIKIFLEELDTG